MPRKRREKSPQPQEKDVEDPLFGDGTNEDDEDDEAPKTVSFSQGREVAMESISNALQDIKRSKLKAKEKRQERDRLLKKQKQRKKISLSNARLPPELLDKLGQQQDLTSRLSEQSSTVKPSERVSDDEVNAEHVDDQDDLDKSDDEHQYSSNLQVIQSSKIVHPPPHEAALQFLHKQMYGSRTHRESTVKHMSKKLKRLGKPGLNFHQKRNEEVKKKKGSF